jgi:hypothetical protein
MTDNSPTLEEHRRLFQAAIRVKELAPWEWMMEADLFGVQDPETDELGFVSVMGNRGEHFAIALYLGSEGLYGFWHMETGGLSVPPERVFEVPQLQAAFLDRDLLHKKDRDLIKQLGLKFRGPNAWPSFRSYRPGFFPWFLTAAEARFLICALEQTADVTPRFAKDPALLQPSRDESYLVRVPRRENGAVVWEDRRMRVPPPEPATIDLLMDFEALESLKRLPRSGSKIEMDFFMLPTPVKEKGDRPLFPYMLMAVDALSGYILGSEMMTPDPSLEEMWGSVPLEAVHQLARARLMPQEIIVRSDTLQGVLEPLAKELGFKLKRAKTLPNLDQAKKFLLQRFV